MKHIKSINQKAARVERFVRGEEPGLKAGSTPAGPPDGPPLRDNARAAGDVVALQQGPPQQAPQPHIPLGCSMVFSPGWEVDQTGGTAGLCQPVERDLFDCHLGCFWPAQVPDQLNHAPDWTSRCAAAQKDWRKIDLIFP